MRSLIESIRKTGFGIGARCLREASEFCRRVERALQSGGVDPRIFAALVFSGQRAPRTTGERVRAGSLLEPLLRMWVAARARRRARSEAGWAPESVPHRTHRETASQVGRLVGMCKSNYRKAKHVLESRHAPGALKRSLMDDEVSIHSAYVQTLGFEREGRLSEGVLAATGGVVPGLRTIRGEACVALSRLRDASVNLVIVHGPPVSGRRADLGARRPAGVGQGHREPMARMLAGLRRVLAPDGSAYVFSDVDELCDMWKLVGKAGLRVQRILAWQHRRETREPRNNWTPSWDPILYVTASDTWTWNGGMPHANVILTAKPEPGARRARDGSAEPIELLERLVRLSSSPGDVVLDLFGVPETIELVAGSLGRRAILIPGKR